MRKTISEARLNAIIKESLDSAIEKLMNGNNDELTPEEKEDLENEYFPKNASAELHNIKRNINKRRQNNWWAQEDEDGNITAENPDYVAWKKRDDDIRRRAADIFYPNEYDHAACEGKISADRDELKAALEEDGFKEMKNGDWWAPDMYPGLRMHLVNRPDGTWQIKKLSQSPKISENIIRLAVNECIRRIVK